MKCYAVIDTNVLVSSLITRNMKSPVVRVIELIIDGDVIPVYSDDTMKEYSEVLHRKKFKSAGENIDILLNVFKTYGIKGIPTKIEEEFNDPKDLPFYEVTMDMQDEGAYLVTGNQKHFPLKPFIVTPRQFIEILEKL